MANSLASLPLPLSLPRQPANTATHNAAQELWLSIYFPKLALEIFETQQSVRSSAVIESVKGQNIIHTVSDDAERYGVHTHMTLSAALALCPQLNTFTLDVVAQQQRLQQLAYWAEHFTSKVSVQAPQALLLEIKGSLKLFGGLRSLLRKIKHGLRQQFQHIFNMAVAPTPAASLILVTNNRSDIVLKTQQLRSVLGQLPIHALPIDVKKKRQLKNIGARQLRDIWRLPQGALARRFGIQLIHYLKQLLGEGAQPLTYIEQTQCFSAYYEFPLETRNCQHVFMIAQQFFQKLVEFLRRRDICITRFEFYLHHHQQSASLISLDIRRPTRDLEHLLLLFKEKLDNLKLGAPVSGVELMVDQFQLFTTRNATLPFSPQFSDDSFVHNSDHTIINKLLEHLQTRLGRTAVQGLCRIPQHCPEKAHHIGDIKKNPAYPALPPRPLWLLNTPKLLTLHNGQLIEQQPLTIISGPERIETGWWDGNDIRRDYYIATDTHGRKLWIYCDLVKQQWYLHGLFA